jgi:hypothetical protein
MGRPGRWHSRAPGAGDGNASGPQRTCGHASIGRWGAASGATGLRKRRRHQRIRQNQDCELEISLAVPLGNTAAEIVESGRGNDRTYALRNSKNQPNSSRWRSTRSRCRIRRNDPLEAHLVGLLKEARHHAADLSLRHTRRDPRVFSCSRWHFTA